MTDGHRHRTIAVKQAGLLHRALTKPTLLVLSRDRAERSRMVFGPTDDPDRWRLSPLGLLHGLFGLTLYIEEPDEGVLDP